MRREHAIEGPLVIEVPHLDVLVARDVYPDGADLIRVAEEIGEWERSGQRHPRRQGDYVDENRTSAGIRLERATHPRLAPFEDALRQVADDCRALYAQHNDYMTARADQGLRLLRYEEGGYFRPHYDQGRRRDHTGARWLSMVLFLNDDFRGGQLAFPRQELEVPPRAGTAVLFPSNFCFPHCARTVRQGTKYSVVTWFE